jgi:DNA polymerase III alpha subunit
MKQSVMNFKHWENYWLFYIESPAMRGLLRRLKCNNYSSCLLIIRPGVAQSGMMKEYILDTTTLTVRIFS